ncbi:MULTISPECIES: HAD-IA family hydrolase [Clostridium]|uniref:HAD-IA family hydrolase n=1 Tax=Clostridium TaxID=1485 RepID=UPI000DEA920B|nr:MULTISPECIES: HAD-IA family hydrolase [Clostridium]AXB83667.1 hypothetical protein DRB99_01545 [Clostridium butyricum]MDB2157103.1 HAD-IA family hydrolase [Clostridium butyricum]MDU1117448.1 HAD-IA family hydrolase [Clostridium sp.]MDU1604645.1 HAD-IA family hydrolase [Clostridium sp.]MDU2896288.1 HAD-IA family hydrolase [Clostridium sp.]
MNNQFISIIMPVYNTEKYLERCIESIINQSYKKIELIIVNDCSPGNAEEIIHEYMKHDSRIKYVTYDKNKGLFGARLEGAKIATGEYIAFIDSDDYVTIDFYNCLIKNAECNKSDIVIGNTIYQKESGENYINNFHDCCFLFNQLEGEEIQKKYFEQKGLCYSWHTVWNKIYRKSLWDRCFPFYNKITEHLIMTEDIAFSTILFYYAKRVTTVQNDGYFYCQNDTASTNVDSITIQKFTKNMQDISLVFKFINEFFEEVNAPENIINLFNEKKKYYARMWNELACNTFVGKDKKSALKIMNEFYPSYNDHTTEDDHFFESINTKWNGGLEHIKDKITNGDYEYISFDIFDTLITRPLYNPTDLFYMLDKKFEEIYKTNVSFNKLRILSESIAREKESHINPSFQDVNIDEIYDYMVKELSIPRDIADIMKKEEKYLEMKLCAQRKSIKELFDLALISGKKVIIVSDMYLDEECITEILKNNGYKGYEKLYLSSTLRLTKYSGAIFKYVLKDLKVDGNKILHLGDTWINDIVNAQKVGMDTVFIPKAIEVFENKISNVATNNCGYIGKTACGIVQNSEELMNSLGYRSMIAVIANKYFDNPYRTFNEFSDFNIDPYFMGYYTVGMHMMGLIKWIVNNLEEDGYETIHFMSRDGYLPMMVYEKYFEKFNDIPRAEYIYTSRKALLPGMLVNKSEYFDLPIEYRNHTPKTILKLLKFCSKDSEQSAIESILKQNGILYNKVFESEHEYTKFIKYYLENLYSQNKYEENYELAQKYYSKLHKINDVTFDLGYSGRIQGSVSRLAEQPINVYFIHSDSKRSGSISRKQGFKIKNFYDFTPNMTGLIREHILSDPGPSCIGFEETNSGIIPVLEHTTKEFQDLFIINLMQKGALDFVDDYLGNFAEYIEYLPFKCQEVSLPFEGMLINSKDIDRKIFNASYFEDLVYGARDKINIYRFINNEISQIHARSFSYFENSCTDYSCMIQSLVMGRNKLIKLITYAVFDRKSLKEKVKNKLKNRPIMQKVCKKLYRGLRKIWRKI